MVTYSIIGGLDYDERPNMEILYETNDFEDVKKVYYLLVDVQTVTDRNRLKDIYFDLTEKGVALSDHISNIEIVGLEIITMTTVKVE